MALLKTKIWSWADIWLLKWSALLFGVAAGAYFSDFVRQYVMVITLVAVLFAIRPVVNYFRNGT